jgi:Tol biopolymer transport system component
MRSRTGRWLAAALTAVAVSAGTVAVPMGSASALTGPAGIIRASVSGTGAAADFMAPTFSPPAISDSGRYIAFDSWASNLVTAAEDGGVFVRDTTAGTTSAVSVRRDGTVDDAADAPAISGDGRYVAFVSDSTGLVVGGNNLYYQVFLRDRTAGTTTRVSTKPNGNQATEDSGAPSISGDGRYVAYESDSPGLVAGDTNEWTDVFVWDRVTNTTRRASVTSTGAEADSGGHTPSISADGRFVAFLTFESLVPGDLDIYQDVYIRDLVANTTTLASVGVGGANPNDNAFAPRISADGKHVTFNSAATNLDGISDTNNASDVFLRDLAAGTTQRVSRSAAGGLAQGAATAPSISANGQFVTYQSTATNAVSDDTNGAPDSFVFNRDTAATTRISTDQLGQQLPAGGIFPVVASNGAYVTFATDSQISGLGASAFRQLYVRLTTPLPPGIVLPEVSIGNASIVEGNTGTRQIRFTVSLSHPWVGATSVTYATASGTATSGTDFTAKSGIATIPAGVTSAMVVVPVKGDRTAEGNETFTVKLRDPQGVVIRRGTGTATVTNDDPKSGANVRVSIGNASVVEGNFGSRTLRFAVTLSAPRTAATTVKFATTTGTANGADFTAKSGTVTIPKNSSSAMLSISVNADTAAEPSETFKVKLSSPVGASIQFGTGTGTIINDD